MNPRQGPGGHRSSLAPKRAPGGRSWAQTLVIASAIVVAAYLVARRPSEPAKESPRAPPEAVAEGEVVPAEEVETAPVPPPPAPLATGAPTQAPVEPPSAPLAAENEGEVPAEDPGPPPQPPTVRVESTAVPCLNGNSPGCAVDVTFDGAHLLLQVDTGADVTMLTTEAAKKAALHWDDSNPVITMRGVAGTTRAVLLRVTVGVGSAKEEDVLISVAPTGLGRSDGLLGMTFLERFHSSIGEGQLRLVPIDRGESPRLGGHGRSWWVMRFRSVRTRLDRLEQVVGLVKDADKQVTGEIGVDPENASLSELLQRFHAFAQAEQEELTSLAGRSSVPLDWRR